ncbi:MAG: methylmalonyl-CoA mutase family protein [Verrucomicrobiota bacterium]
MSDQTTQPITFEEFPIPSYEAWRKEAEATLDGAPFEKKLVTRLYEGIDVQPIYRREDLEKLDTLGSLPGQAPYIRGISAESNSWEVAQEIPYGFAKDFNDALKSDLERGQTAVNITLDQATRHGVDPDAARIGESGFCGVSITTCSDFSRLLDGVDLEKTPVYMQGGSAALPLLGMLVAFLRKNGKGASKLRGGLENDPVNELLMEGKLPLSTQSAFDQMALTTRWANRETPKLATIAVNAHAYHNAGGSAVQDLAFALATGVEYLRQMEARGLSVDEVAPKMRFAFSMGPDFFGAIAKLRAARLLWSRIVAACGGNEESQKMHIHARTSLWNKSTLDPYVNMLRDTTEAFAAIAGGCESLHVGAFDEVIRPPDEFSRRIARNTQIILRDECHFDQVIDPGGGSYYVETLTSQFANAAWTLFQQVEKQGGIFKSLAAGFPQKEVAAVQAKKAEAIAQRRLSLIGVNVYANATEKPLETGDFELYGRQMRRADYAAAHKLSPERSAEVLAHITNLLHTAPDQVLDEVIKAADEGTTLGQLFRTLSVNGGEAPEIEAISVHRASEPFEVLRAAVRASANAKVFLANMGPVRQHKPRADFATGFFQAGDFQVLENRGFATVDEAYEAAIASGASVTVICSTDDTYPEIVPALAQKLKAANPNQIIVLAGYPKDHIEAFKQAGVDEFIHIRANCFEVLRGIAIKLGID